MVIAILPFVVCIIGALVYALAANGKASEMGRLAYFAGLLALVLSLAGHVLRLG